MEDRTIVEPAMPAMGTGEATRVMNVPPAGGMGMGDATQHAITVTCPVCQTPNPPGEPYCQDCGLLFGSTPDEVEPLPDASQLPRLVEAASGREFALNPGVNSVGREAADILLVDPTVSRRHAQVTLQGSEAIVEDLGSTNGSYVAGRRLAPGEQATAYNGDTVRFGNIHLSLTLPGAASRPEGAVAPAAAAPAVEAAADRGPAVGSLVLADGTEFPLYEGANTLGRRSGNQIVIADAFMSGKHAEIRCAAEGSAELVDIGSTNGTFFAGERLAHHTPVALTDGTTFTMGKTPVTFRSTTAAIGNGPAPMGDFELPADTTVALSTADEGAQPAV